MRFGRLGAQGVPGAVALTTTLDEIALITEPYKTPQACARHNMLHLTRSATGYAYVCDCGIRLDKRKITDWLAGERTPGAEQQARLEDAYRRLRRRNMRPSLTGRLNADGGTRVEIHSVDQNNVAPQHQRTPRWRHKNIYRWDPIVTAWSRSDWQGLTHQWLYVITDLGSDRRHYEYVSHLGFWA